MISDGIHLHPAVVRGVRPVRGRNGVPDQRFHAACGMPNGEYSLGGQKVFMNDGLATLEDGTIGQRHPPGRVLPPAP